MADRVDVVIVGAGLAGLSAAVRLHEAGREVVVVEAGDAVGGRVRTDLRDGLRLDRGFQLFNPSYPAASIFDLDALDLKPFKAGVAVSIGDDRFLLADPRRWPAEALSSVRAPVGSMLEKLRFAQWALTAGTLPADRILRATDRTLRDELQAHGLDGRIGEAVIRPFLAGVLAEDDLTTSAIFARLLVRSFVRGTPSIPAAGMQALPEQLAARLPDGAVRLNCAALDVGPDRVRTADGDLGAHAVIVAADPVTAASLTGLPVPATRALTTYYHRAAASPSPHAVLHVDGERRGPVINTAVLSDAAPTYCVDGALIASTVLGADGALEPAVRAHSGLIFGVDPGGWEHVATYSIPVALPALPPPLDPRQPVALDNGLFVAGDHRDTASIQGALVSGKRAAHAVMARS